MAYRIRNLILWLFACSVSVLLNGQETPVPLQEYRFYVASSARIRNVRFGVYDEAGTLIKSSRTGFRTSGRSVAYEYKGPSTMTFFEEHPAPTPENPKAVRREPVATVTLPETVEEVLFLFNKNNAYPKEGLKYEVQWIDLGSTHIPEGHITIFNTLPITMQGAVGKKPGADAKGVTLTVKPGINPPLKIQPRATVLLALESRGEGIVRIYEDTIHCEPDERVLLIIFPPRFPGSHNVGSKIITFHTRPEATPTPAPPPTD